MLQRYQNEITFLKDLYKFNLGFITQKAAGSFFEAMQTGGEKKISLILFFPYLLRGLHFVLRCSDRLIYLEEVGSSFKLNFL
jgi:hypothetical protein